ncbi:head-tail connector protein [Algoriphagus aquimarinus]|uniref:head-tail connector protein n=1 Tax=Algoriphagus aquimarinus TaxID=237018 RepID=UPI0030D790D8|tara:strand:- start:41746 stop:42294 length:549 start_codon:yes stop_codon:yes gene_type:complete
MIANLVKKTSETIVTLAEAKGHLRILHTNEDFYIDSLLTVITTAIENNLDKDLVDTSYQLGIFSKIQEGEEIYFPNAPIYNVTSVEIKDSDEVIPAESYSYTFTDEYIKFTALPVSYTKINIIYKKGFESSEDVPTPIKQAALLMLSDLYLYRGSILVGKSVMVLEKSIEALLRPYKNVKFM